MSPHNLDRISEIDESMNKKNGTETNEVVDDNKIMNKNSFNNYIDRKKKYREKVKGDEDKFDNRYGSGKKWKPQVTIPEQFVLGSKKNSNSGKDCNIKVFRNFNSRNLFRCMIQKGLRWMGI